MLNHLMYFDEGELFHIYNQGNNRQKIFFEEGHYEYFLRKMTRFILPYADILAWCLMPNHFHIMIRVNTLVIDANDAKITDSKDSVVSRPRTLNQSIGIALRSYARGINIKRNRSGSLFRNNTKSAKVTSLEGVMPNLYRTKNVQILKSILTDIQYPQICLNYIHLNPVRSRLVKKAIDWKYSSAQDFARLRDSEITNIELAREIIGLTSGAHLSEPLTY